MDTSWERRPQLPPPVSGRTGPSSPTRGRILAAQDLDTSIVFLVYGAYQAAQSHHVQSATASSQRRVWTDRLHSVPLCLEFVNYMRALRAGALRALRSVLCGPYWGVVLRQPSRPLPTKVLQSPLKCLCRRKSRLSAALGPNGVVRACKRLVRPSSSGRPGLW